MINYISTNDILKVPLPRIVTHNPKKKSDSIFKDTSLKHYVAGKGIYLFPLTSDLQDLQMCSSMVLLVSVLQEE